jgi:uncharacterized membrane protein
MNHRKIKNYIWLFIAIICFVLGTFFSVAGPDILKVSGGLVGLIVAISSLAVIFITPVFGKLSGIIIFYPIGSFLVYRFIKEYKRISENV